MRLAFLILAAALPLFSQAYAPQTVVGTGPGFASPNGKFGYLSESSLIGQATYTTVAQQWTLMRGRAESCTLAGLTKVTNQWGPITVGVTGLGGGCEGMTGSAQMVASGQGFVQVRIRKSAWSMVVTGQKISDSDFKVSAGVQWAK